MSMAKHPITGKDIRIMKTQTHLYKNQKTMYWLQETPEQTHEAHTLNRWYTATTSWELAEAWKSVLGSYPSAIIITEPSPEVNQWLATSAPKQQQILFLSKAVMASFDRTRFTKEGFVNVVCLEELVEMFPHVQERYQSGQDPALTLLSVAALFRVQRVYGFTDEQSNSVKAYYESLKEAYGIQCGDQSHRPEKLWLVQQYFESPKPKRQREIKKCLQKNLENPFVDQVLLLNEEDYMATLPSHSRSGKLLQQVIGHRLTYADVILTIQEKVPANTLVVFANSDIYLDSVSWKDVWAVDLHDVFLSLLRYEEPTDPTEEPKLFGPRPDSQDTWLLHSDSVKSRSWDFKGLDFEFGRSGCDNAINVEMLRKKFVVANPSLSLKTLHCHASQVRTYNPEEVVEKPVFLYLEPTGLHDLDPLSDIQSSGSLAPPSTFDRRIHCYDEKMLKTFCTMASRDEKVLLKPFSANTYVPSGATNGKLYKMENAFVTPNGLVYGYDKIYMTAGSKESWSNTTISYMTPCVGIKEVLAAPLSDETSASLWDYMLNYLSVIFQLKEQGHKGDMWMPRDTRRLVEFMQHFQWEEEVMPVIPRDKDAVAFAKSVTHISPRSETMIQKEDVEALRKKLRGYVPTSEAKRVVIFQDDDLLTAEDVSSLEAQLENQGYEVDIVYPTRSSPNFILQRCLGVSTCISAPGNHKLYWLLPQGAKVIDVVPETKIAADAAHMAGACGLDYWVAILPRAKGETKRNLLVERVMKTLVATAPSTTSADPTKPTIIVPTNQTGIHNHSGDSFREMAALWAEKGWASIEFSESTPYVWLNGIGDTLLYDRATPMWLQKTPATYKRALIGNMNASIVPNAKQWSFWPRRPVLLERYIENKTLPSWSDRSKTLVFYGRVENQVQHDRRKNELHKACDDFDMPIGSTESYKYSPEEYLEQLSKAKFGLCLAGYGSKCNREIECMALGTIPVVAPDVDMELYADPPQEGIHYLRLKTFDPEEASSIIKSIDEHQWTSMSKAAHEWWVQNASAKGLYDLTMRLSL
jgi:hypothetical protein